MNVKFYFGLQEKYDALVERDELALYFIEDTRRLYKGDILIATGADATSMASGLMSAEDKIKLDSLVVGAISNLTPVDSTIVITDADDGSKSIGVAISTTNGNLIAVKDDGLFVAVDSILIDNVVGLKDRLEAVESALVGGIRYKGSVDTVEDLPENAVQGDLYEVLADNSEWCFNGEKWFEYGKSSVFTPVAGDGIEIVDSTISVKIADESHGLTAVNGELLINLATTESDGAMSKEDKALLAALPNMFATIDQVNELKKSIENVEESYTWGEL